MWTGLGAGWVTTIDTFVILVSVAGVVLVIIGIHIITIAIIVMKIVPGPDTTTHACSNLVIGR